MGLRESCEEKKDTSGADEFPSDSRVAAATVPELEGPKQTIEPRAMTTGCTLPNSGDTAHNPFSHVSQLEVRLTVPPVLRLNHNRA